MSTGTQQCTIFRFPPLQKPGLASAYVYVYICIECIYMVVLSNPGTYRTRKCSSWCADIHKDPKYRHPEIQHSKNQKIQKPKNPKIKKSKNPKIKKIKKNPKNPKIQNVLHLRNLAFFLDFWIFRFFGFLGFWILIFGFLCFTLVLSICRNNSKIGLGEKTAFVSVFTVVVRGVRAVAVGVTIYI